MIKREKTAVEAAVHPYKTRSGGATVTVFVPYDCRNHCPFCVNKEEYADMTGFSLEAICQSIRKMDALTPYCDFVFTGGEPLANLKSLQVMLDQVSDTHKVYINTTLPVIGIPINATPLNGMDSLLSFVQMPSGIPVATMAINGAKNAAIFAVEILAGAHPELVQKLADFRARMQEEVKAKGEKLAAARAAAAKA